MATFLCMSLPKIALMVTVFHWSLVTGMRICSALRGRIAMPSTPGPVRGPRWNIWLPITPDNAADMRPSPTPEDRVRYKVGD